MAYSEGGCSNPPPGYAQDEFERQHNRELFVRLVLEVIAASCTMAFVLYLLYANWQTRRAASAKAV